ncbi:sensor histidine kinase [Amnibacterium endophyticum]|uniref:histidine kinase n=1 Tax=Amnibacterium endophyticum TaxID=2109337 RepID=A0ABW4LG35_9MICO
MLSTLSDRWNGISLRTKITAVTVLVLTLGLATSGAGSLSLLRSYLLTDSDRQIVSTLESVNANTVANDEMAAATQFVFAHLDGDGAVIRANPRWQQLVPEAVEVRGEIRDARPLQAFTIHADDGSPEYRMAVKPLGDGTLAVLGLPLQGVNNVVSQLLTLFVLFGLAVVVVGAVLTRILVSSTFAPLRQVERTAAAIADGDFGQRLGNATPNTEVGRLNRSLNRMLNQIDGALADRARTIDQMRRFVGDASHELRTPLVSVRGYAELYRMGALQSREDVGQAMDRIEREAVRLGALVSDLLALARLDEARELKRTEVELLPLAHDAALDARALAPGRTIRVIGHDPEQQTGALEILRPVPSADADAVAAVTTSRLFRRGAGAGDAASVTASLRLASARLLRQRRKMREGGEAEPVDAVQVSGSTRPVVFAEEDKLRQVLTNLIGNAIRFTPADSPIEIAAYADRVRSLAVFEVIDHGEGIPPQVREKIFQRFWRADSSRTRDTGGSGLGLAIVAAIVQAHQGTIGISETAGGGATFRVALPLLHSPDPEPETDDESDPAEEHVSAS